MKNINSPGEPLWTVAGVVAFVAAVLALLSAFGLDLTDDQRNAILGLVAILAPLVVALLSRNKVVPLDNVVALKNKDGDTVAANAASQANGTEVDVTTSRAA